MNTDILWNKFLDKIKERITPLSYDTWFKDTKLYKIDGGTATILVPYALHKKHLEENYIEDIEDTFNSITGTNFNFQFVLENEIENNNEENQIVNNESESFGVPHQTSASANLNSEYTFDSFIVGNSNRFASTAAKAVAEKPGKAYNPLFLYGKSGLGKTHLMHAIGNYIIENTNKKVLYVSSEQFVNDYISAVRNSDKNSFEKIDSFKNKYRNIDVLIIDDIQFLGGAEKSQQEFFHTFNNLYNDSKQIIVSSDRSPEDLKFLEDRLKTRFCWGLQVDIDPPDFALKVLIIKKKIRGENIFINDDVINYIASNVGNDVRQLEGSINRLVAYSAIMNESKITVDFAMEALKDFTKKQVTDSNSIRRIQKEVANFYKISYEDIKSKKRTPNLAIPRQVAMYLCRKLTDESFERIGIEFAGKNHATVIHACNKIDREIKINADLKNAIDDIEKQLV